MDDVNDEVTKALDVIECYWDKYGYLGDEWQDVWDELDVSAFSKQVALNEWRRKHNSSSQQKDKRNSR